jgi:hypothetical protein
MTVSAVTAGSTTAAVVGVGAGQVSDPGAGFSTAASALAFTGAPHLALEGFVGALLVMIGLLLTGLARRHRGIAPALVPGPGPRGTRRHLSRTSRVESR